MTDLKLSIGRGEIEETLDLAIRESENERGRPVFFVELSHENSDGDTNGFTMGEGDFDIGPGQLRKISKFFRQCADKMDEACDEHQKDQPKVVAALQKLTPAEIEALGIDLDEFGLELAKA